MRRLIIRPGAIGDCILALPAMEALRAAYTEIWVPSQNVSLVRFADCVCGIASTGLDLLGIPDVVPPAQLLERLAGFDKIVSWYGENRPEFRAAVAGLPFRFLPALPPAGLHAADFYLRQVSTGALPAVPRIQCLRAPSGFAVIHPFSGSVKKNWPLEQYRALARALALPVRWCAGPSEPLDEAVRILDLYELACWLARARVYIGNDSGITHLAAAVGTPVVAVFVATDPTIWAPRGPCVTVLNGDISVEQVVEAAVRGSARASK